MNKQFIDLRSDTVTKPSLEMLNFMFNAEVGDDVLGDDPTVKALEEITAKLFNMEAAVYCPSDTMANQIGIKTHTNPGDEVICDESAHIYRFEAGGIAMHSGCSVRLLNGDRGRFTAKDVAENINDPNNLHLPVTKLVALENTSNRGGGSCYEFSEIKKIAALCKKENLKLHLDGARIFNAMIAKNEKPEQYGAIFDSISVCLSKGLGAPVGSVLLGTKEFIAKARRYRKAFGGGMRQAGYIAAAGIYALENNIQRLADDHTRAKILSETLSKLNYVEHVLPTETNIVIFKLKENMPTNVFLEKLKENNIAMLSIGVQSIRAVTHLNFSDDQLETTCKALKSLA